MSELATAQTVFAHLLRDAKAHEDAVQAFVGTAASLAPRLALYRGNVQANARKALAAAYPVVEQLVGAEFFDGLAREYGRRSPSREGDLTRYGDAFDDFLRDFEHVRDLPYLADVAALDWAVHCAHYAADAERFDALQLASRPDEEWGTLRVRLHPACAVLSSSWPLARIWSVHQRDHAGDRTVPFDDATHWCLVYRPQWRVQVGELGAGEHAFLEAAIESATLHRCVDVAVFADASFDLGPALAAWIEARVIVDLS